METKTRGRHRAAGKHAVRQITIEDTVAKKPPTGRRSAVKNPVPVVIVPPKPDRKPMTWLPANSFNPKDMPADTQLSETPSGRISIVRHKKPLTALAAIATGGMLLVGGNALATQPARVDSKQGRHAVAGPSDLERESEPVITAAQDVVLTQEKVAIASEPAPPPPPAPEPVVVEKPASVALPAAEPRVVTPVAPKPAVPAPVAPAPVAPPPAPAASGKAAAIASAALGQIGVYQDCTMLVTNSLAAVGIRHHGWPISYYSLGYGIPASEAVPGDLIYYVYGSGPGSLAHIAVYIGNGQAVHGGWNGNETRVFSVNVGSGPQYIRVTK